MPVSDAFAFPWTFWHVPQMGTEVVEGSGCGANGDLPDTIPDGLWYGQVISANADGLAFDVRCLFYGELATQLYQEYVGEHPDEASPPYIDGTWTVNNSTRTRNVPVSANFAIYPAEAVPTSNCPTVACSRSVACPTVPRRPLTTRRCSPSVAGDRRRPGGVDGRLLPSRLSARPRPAPPFTPGADVDRLAVFPRTFAEVIRTARTNEGEMDERR